MTVTTYDLLVVGGGAAGSTAASTASEMHKHVALIEEDKLGGTCLNYGCDPTKTLLHIATILHQSRHAQHYGLEIPPPAINWEQVQTYVQEIITRIRGGSVTEAIGNLKQQGIDVFHHNATFISPNTLKVGDQTLQADKIIIASGTQTSCPSVSGLKELGYITNKEAVVLKQLPAKLAIIGGGPLGIEFAQLLQRFGVEVVVLEHGEQILKKEEPEMIALLRKILSDEGIQIETGVELQRAERADNGKKRLVYQQAQQSRQLEVDEILIASGRIPQLDTLNPAAANLHITEKGITVDATLRTNNPHIWAAGDITGGPRFTHVASDQGRLAAQNAFAAIPKPFTDQPIPWVTYTDPPLAHAGQTEQQLQQAGTNYKVARLTFKENERAITNGRTRGLIKLLVGMDDTILGGHILGDRADDLIAQIILAMRTGITAQFLADTILPYPTLSEVIRWTADRF
ncbi:mercuric reductase [Dictyobacter alpinus]|uniref:Mercuric reductase n=1 Tax=Dictyobacter alpinus TaxID=2014873 RepID=A0A402B725_9CHLR|nr:NAD(P)/FAD-dependent oxidoreductase [Dictyobacter alpinus]GCE27171.1 mercuric reductase [Dictyobacter alpinus]